MATKLLGANISEIVAFFKAGQLGARALRMTLTVNVDKPDSAGCPLSVPLITICNKKKTNGKLSSSYLHLN